MNQDKTVNRVLNEMEFAELIPRDKKRTARKQYLHQVYAAGFDYGRAIPGRGGPKKISKFSPAGEYIESYPSAQAAADAHGVGRSNISKAATGVSSKAGGFYWRYDE